MLGTIVNAGAVIAGGLIGLCLKQGVPDRYKDMALNGAGLATIVLGLNAAIGNLAQQNITPILLIICLVTGSLLGEKLDLDKKMKGIGDSLERRMSKTKGNISKGFVTSSLLFCTGSMAILGALDSGIHADHSILYAKSVLDGTMSIVFASSMGLGVLFSSISVFVYQGSITLLASFIAPFLTSYMIAGIATIGGVIMVALGLNLLKITDIKIANMLPSLFVPVAYYAIIALF